MAPRQASPRRRPATAPVAALGRTLQRTFARAVAEFGQAGVPFAVVGGVAVGVRAEPRVTRDLDFALVVDSDAEAEQILHSLQARGFLIQSVFENAAKRISTVRTLRRESPRVFVDLLLHNSRIEREIVEEATTETLPGVGPVRIAQAWHLLAMKTLANRPKDQPDLEHLFSIATQGCLARAQRALRLMQDRGVAPDRNLLSEWRDLVARMKAAPAHERPVSPSRLRRLRRSPRRR